MEYDTLNKNLKLLVQSSFLVFIGLSFSKFFTYVYRIIMARYFGPEIYGIFSLSLMILSVFVSFSLFGLSEGLLRYIPFYRGENKKQEISYLFRFSNYFVLFSGIFFAFILFTSSNFISINIFHDPQLIIFLKIFSFLIPINSLANIFLSTIKSFEKIKIYTFSLNFLSNLIKVLFLIIFIYFGFKTNSIPLSYFAGIFVMFLFSFFYCKYKLPSVFIKDNLEQDKIKNTRKSILFYSVPLMFSSFISMIFFWTDSFFIGFFKTSLEVGIYNAAIPISLLLIFVPELFMQLFFPIINKEYSKKNNHIIEELSKQVTKWIFIVNILLVILIFLFTDIIINILFGQEYILAKLPVRILLIGQLFFSIFLISQHLILMKGKSRVVLFDIFLVSLINIVLNYFLVPMQKILWINNLEGLNGAAISTTLSLIILSLIFLVQAKNYINVFPLRRKIVNVFFASIFPFFLILLIKGFLSPNFFSFVILSFIFIVVYLTLLFVFRGLDKNDLFIIDTIKRRIKEI